MTPARLDFTREEYDSRLAKVRRAMAAAEVDLLIVSDPSNMAWLTGYDGWSFYVHQCVLLAGDGEPLWFGRGQDAHGARATTWLADERIVRYPDDHVMSRERHPMDVLAGVIEKHGWSGLSIGVEKDNYYFSAKCLERLEAGLPNALFKDTTGLVNWQRAVKSEQELIYMRRAARIVEAIHARVFELVEPGLPKHELVAEIYRTGILGAEGHWGDYPAIVPLLPSGSDAAAAHLTWDDRPFRSGEGTFFELAGCHRRYHCPLSRTIFLGKPTETFLKAETAVLEGMEAGLEKARAGNTCEDIANAFFGALEKHGIEKGDRAGYPIGLSYPPDWGERTMSIRRGDRSVLEPNMTFHFMTGLWMDDWGFEITESIVIGEGEPELLTRYPRKLFVKD